MKKIIVNLSLLATLSGVALTSCSREFTDTQFHQSELAGSITTVEQLTSFVNGTYAKMRSSNYLGNLYKGYGEVHSDEMYSTLASGRNQAFATYAITRANGDVENLYYAIYQVIGNANIVINAPENLTWGQSSNATTVATQIKYLKGQAYAARALAFFDALRIFGQKYTGGNLGIVLPTTYNPNALQGRATIAETEAQIEADFQAALTNLGDEGTAINNQFNKNSVKALMSRYYLYKGDYALAAQYAKDVINSGAYTPISSSNFVRSFSESGGLNSVFEITLGLNGALGTTSYDYIANSNGYANLAALTSTINAYDASDVRKNALVDEFLDNKFSNLKGTSNIKYIRYEEVLLNAAEALIKQGNTAEATTYINLIRQNRGISALSSVTFDDVKKERMLELLGEGFRYWDLLRWGETIPYYDSTGNRDTSKDKTIGDSQLAFPIPEKEVLTPGSLVVQNPGY